MPRIKISLALKIDDFDKYIKALEKFNGKAEESINNYLHNDATRIIVGKITNEMPRSNRNKNKWGSFRKPLNTKHAKDNKWYKSFNWNLAAALSNKTSGGTKNSFYYLFYPHEGTQKIKRKNPFAQKGLEKNIEFEN